MSRPPFRVTLLDAAMIRSEFKSNSEPLDRYFKQQVSQDVKRRVTSCFVALSDKQQIACYYTLASGSVRLSDLPENLSRKLPRYPSVPVVRMGRLAVDQNFKGQGLGAALLADALIRCGRAEIAAYALIVDAKDQTAADFYRHHGFAEFLNQPLTLFLPLSATSTI